MGAHSLRCTPREYTCGVAFHLFCTHFTRHTIYMLRVILRSCELHHIHHYTRNSTNPSYYIFVYQVRVQHSTLSAQHQTTDTKHFGKEIATRWLVMLNMDYRQQVNGYMVCDYSHNLHVGRYLCGSAFD